VHFNQIIKIGEILELVLDDGAVKTKVQDIDGDEFTVLRPTFRAVPVHFESGEIYPVRFYRPDGIYKFGVRVLSQSEHQGVRLCRMQAVTEVEKSQRRQYFRLPIVMPVIMRPLEEADESAPKKAYKGKTIDISERGTLVDSFTLFPKDALLDIDIDMLGLISRHIKARVFKSMESASKKEPHRMVLLFEDYGDRDRAYLGRFILRQQIMQRKKQRGGDEP